jgi:3-phosphoinositide dependent protein kinase-1
LLDDKFHIRLTDFGTARILTDETDPTTSNENTDLTRRRRNSFVGTAQFVAPEILQGKSPHIGCDLWALGCIIYQMLTGEHLFKGK